MRRNQPDQPVRPTTSWFAIVVLLIAAVVLGWYVLFTARGIDLSLEESQKQADIASKLSVQSIDLGAEKPVVLPTLAQLTPNSSWMYVSRDSPLATEYKPDNLQDITVPHADEQSSMKLRADVHDNLESLFEVATENEYDLMVSSAYRSVADQQKLYDTTVQTNGEIYAKKYVLTPGASEHHTGYALDVTDASSACTKDSDDCILSSATAAWVADNAHQYGFIVRYPGGKEAETGISHEPWHLRYVGVVLATQLYETDTAFDEFIEQIAPGRLVRQ